jgi:hypothetical protein
MLSRSGVSAPAPPPPHPTPPTATCWFFILRTQVDWSLKWFLFLANYHDSSRLILYECANEIHFLLYYYYYNNIKYFSQFASLFIPELLLGLAYTFLSSSSQAILSSSRIGSCRFLFSYWSTFQCLTSYHFSYTILQ